MGAGVLAQDQVARLEARIGLPDGPELIVILVGHHERLLVPEPERHAFEHRPAQIDDPTQALQQFAAEHRKCPGALFLRDGLCRCQRCIECCSLSRDPHRSPLSAADRRAASSHCGMRRAASEGEAHPSGRRTRLGTFDQIGGGSSSTDVATGLNGVGGCSRASS
jgi:hypothetical protein